MNREEILEKLKKNFLDNSLDNLYQKIAQSKYQEEIINLLFSKINKLITDKEFEDTKKKLLTEILDSAGNLVSTASMRAPDGYNLTKAMSDNNMLFKKFGGHPQAAGFSATNDKLESIHIALKESLYTQSLLLAKDVKIYINEETLQLLPQKWKFLAKQKQIIELDISAINSELLNQISQLDPFGIDFPLPNFLCILKINQIKSYKLLGTESKHIKIYFWDTPLSITAFNVENMNNLIELLDNPNTTQNFLIVSKLSENIWRQTRSLELIAEYLDYF